ncbi:MAG: dihydrolipoamide acetyltransferase family protein [Gemmobacter sp.]
MPVEVIMPKVDMDMVRGRLSVWHVAEGEAVTQGQPLFDIETDKAAMEIESPATGRLGTVLAQPGQDVDVGATVAWVYAEGEVPTPASGATAPAATAPSKVAPVVDAAVAVEAAGETGTDVRATPLARRTARAAGIDLALVAGTGPRGRIHKSDVEAAIRALRHEPKAAAPVPPPTPAPAAAADLPGPVPRGYADRPHTLISLDGMRRTVAARLTEAKQTIPHFYLRLDVCLDPLLDIRTRLNAELAPRNLRVSVNDFVIRACARALQDVPEANAIWTDAGILRLGPSDIAVAVAVDGGLFTPVLRDAETKSLTTLSLEMKALADRARARKLAPADYQGGSFAISNLGMFGILGFDAIINPPHAAILAVGAATLRPIVRPDRSFDAATMMSLTLSVDHRVIDGALGATLFRSIKDHLESPLALMA